MPVVPTAELKPTLLAIDTRDDRREIWCLLHKLSPRDRVRFLGRACRRIRARDGCGPRPSRHRMAATIEQSYRCGRADDRLTNEVYGDLLVMGAQYGLDMPALAAELERIVRGRQPLDSPLSA